jgi:predicted dehydrogenase
MARLRMAVVGVGHLGQSHARILAGLPEVELVGVVDVDPDQAQTVAARTGSRAYTDFRQILGAVDAATVVVPTIHHYAVASEFLARGVPVLVEKPLAPTVEQAQQLVDLANRHHTILQVGHIERFNPAYEELRSRPIQPKFVEAERHGPFTGRSTDIGAVLDLMIHDIDLLLNLVGAPVVQVDAIGAAVFGGHEDMVNARLVFATGCVATLTASRMSRQPKRRLRIWAPEGYAGLDFVTRRLTLVQPSAEVRERGLDLGRLDPALRTLLKDEVFGRYLEMLHLDCNQGDQLTRELQHFIRCVQTGSTPRVSGEDGRDAVAVAERILSCVRTHAWNGVKDGPVGPWQLPRPRGQLFTSQNRAAA